MVKIMIMQCKEAFLEFRGVIAETDMPTVDVDATVQVLIESLKEDNDGTSIYDAVHEIAFEGRLFEQVDNDDGVELRLYAASLRLASEIKKELVQHHAYVDGHLPFTFKKFINDDTFYLTRI